MNKATSKALLAAGAMALAVASSGVRADVLTFVGPNGAGVAPTVEGVFKYDTLSGNLFRDTDANGDTFDIEGTSGIGGVLRVVRNDVAGGLFTFNGSDVQFEFGAAVLIDFEGFLGGVSQGIDSFLTTATSDWSTKVSLALAGVQIDELRVTLDAPSGTAEDIDNLNLTPTVVPEPGVLALLGLGLAGLGFGRRRKA